MDPRAYVPEGTVLDGNYRIRRVLGAGGFGVTYEAEDVKLGTTVAIKEYFPELFGIRVEPLLVRPSSDRNASTFEWGRQSFLSEARTLAQFRHPTIVRVMRVFEANSTAYMVMEYEAGQSLETWLKSLGRSPTQAELDRIVEPILEALQVMHDNEFIHRDIAPDNIIIRDNGTPVLLDFGAARRAIAEKSHVLTGMVKQGYSPHEQYSTDGKLQGPWSDIYALGATLYRSVMGRPPEDAPARSVEDNLPPAASALHKGYRGAFLGAIDRCLNMHPRGRPQSIPELRAALLPNAEKEPSKQAHPKFLQSGDEAAEGHGRIVRVGLLICVGMLTSYLIAMQYEKSRRTETVATELKKVRDFRALEASERWASLRMTEDIADIQRFIEQYVGTPAEVEAQLRLRQLLERAEARKRQDEAELLWNDLKDAIDPEKIKAFIQRYGDTPQGDLARAKLAELVAKRERQLLAEREWDSIRTSMDQNEIRAFIQKYSDLDIGHMAKARLNELRVCVIFSGEVTNQWSQKNVIKARVTNQALNPPKQKIHKIREGTLRWCYNANNMRFEDIESDQFFLEMPFSGTEVTRSAKVSADTADHKTSETVFRGNASRVGNEILASVRHRTDFTGTDHNAWAEFSIRAVFNVTNNKCNVVRYELIVSEYMDNKEVYNVAHLMATTGWLSQEQPIRSNMSCRILPPGR